MPRFSKANHPDYVIVFATFFLVVFGLVMLASASSDLARIRFGDSYYYLKHQIIYGLFFGIAGFFITSKFYYQKYKKLSPILLFISLASLLLVFTPLGFSARGASRWISLGPITFQPVEFLKIAFIIYVAAWLSGDDRRRLKFWSGFVPFLSICGLVSALLIVQPATSMVVILLIAVIADYFVSGAPVSFILGFISLALIAVMLVTYMTPYRWERVMSFINPDVNTQTSSYHINQALIAIGSGGLTGVGLGQSTTKIYYLPEPIGDSIFAIIAEELGFIGAGLLILAFLILVMRGLILSRKTDDKFAQLLLVGFSVLIGIQAFFNIGAISGLLPLTGVSLPFISYGGTSLAIFMTISGIMINISKHIKS